MIWTKLGEFYMKLITYDKFIIHSHFSVEQLTSILEGMTTKKGIFNMNATTPFIGAIHTDGFKVESFVQRANGFYTKNSFAPVTTGKYEETENGVDIVVTQRLSLSVIAFLTVWTSFLILASAIIALSGEMSFIFIPILMILGVAIMVILGFNSAAKKNHKLLKDVLQ